LKLSRRRALIAASVIAAALAACSRGDPERELRATLAAMAEAIEQHRVGDALAPVAEDFTRESSTFGKQDARRALAGAALRNEKIRVSAAVTELRLDGDRATAKVRVFATGGSGLVPDRGHTWEFDTAWRREQGRWKVYNAEWREGL